MTPEISPTSNSKSSINSDFLSKLEAQKKRQDEIRRHLLEAKKTLVEQEAALSSTQMYLMDVQQRSQDIGNVIDREIVTNGGGNGQNGNRLNREVNDSSSPDYHRPSPVVVSEEEEGEDDDVNKVKNRVNPIKSGGATKYVLTNGSHVQNMVEALESSTNNNGKKHDKSHRSSPVDMNGEHEVTSVTGSTKTADGCSIPTSVESRPSSKRSVTSSVTMDMAVETKKPSRKRDRVKKEGKVLEDAVDSASSGSSGSKSSQNGRRRLNTHNESDSSSTDSSDGSRQQRLDEQNKLTTHKKNDSLSTDSGGGSQQQRLDAQNKHDDSSSSNRNGNDKRANSRDETDTSSTSRSSNQQELNPQRQTNSFSRHSSSSSPSPQLMSIQKTDSNVEAQISHDDEEEEPHHVEDDYEDDDRQVENDDESELEEHDTPLPTPPVSFKDHMRSAVMSLPYADKDEEEKQEENDSMMSKSIEELVDDDLVERCRKAIENHLSDNNISIVRDDAVSPYRERPKLGQTDLSMRDPEKGPIPSSPNSPQKPRLSLNDHLSESGDFKPQIKRHDSDSAERSVGFVGENISQRSIRTALSRDHSRIGGDPVWGARKVYKDEEKVETEGWVYLMTFTLFSITTVGVTVVVLFVFGAANSTNEDKVLLSYIKSISPDVSVFADEKSPQSLAFNWLVEDKVEPGDNDWSRIESRYALAVLWFSTNGDDSWNDRMNFLTDEHECDWVSSGDLYGFNIGLNLIGVHCNRLKQIVNITIVDNNLRGTIPSELVFMSDLEILNLSNNELFGTVPSLQLEKLQHLNLQNNVLSGPLPGSIGEDYQNLNRLDLSHNSLSSSLPPSFQELTTLRELHISGNRLSGSIPEQTLLNLDKLTVVNVTSNTFGGSLDFLQQSGALRSIDLSYNMFDGSIPEFVGELTNLHTLLFSNNLLQGSLPETMGGLTSLNRLVGYSNNLSGNLPSSIFMGGGVPLVEISLSDNYISGIIPPHIDVLASTLQVLDLQRNQIRGRIPFFIGKLTRLSHLQLSLNKLTGPLPFSLGLLSTIKSIDLAVNDLTGTVPEILKGARKLEVLNLDNNNFTGTVPAELAYLEDLERVALHGNDFNGSLEFFCATAIPVITADCGGHPPRIECSCCSFCL